MFIGFTPEQQLLRGSVHSLLADLVSEADVRRVMASADGQDPRLWSRMHELGLIAITIPEHLGGEGASLVEQGVVLEEMGRSVCCGPYFSSSVIATQALLNTARLGATEDVLRRIAAGAVATLALSEGAGEIVSRARFDEGHWRLDGSKPHVPDGAGADLILVAARSEDGISLFAVEADAPGLSRTALPTLDQTRRQARLDFDDTPALLLGEQGGAWPGLERALQAAAVALAAEQVGGAQFVLEMVVEHARVRHQFGRPIGSFQAVQHRCADLLVEVEAARSAAYYGLAVAAANSTELALAASIAKSHVSETYRRITNEAIQLLGGIGLTWEHPIHLYLKRALSSNLLLGTPAHHRRLLARYLAL